MAMTYPHSGSNPPFTVPAQNPTILPDPPMAGITGGVGYEDPHFYETTWIDFSTRRGDYMESAQAYQFRDTVLNTSWSDGVLASFVIKREMINDPDATYIFKTTKTGTGGFSQSCTETP